MLSKKDWAVIAYCEAYLDQMWAAMVCSIILECDFRDVKQKIKELRDD